MNKRLFNMIQVALAILTWLALAQLQDWISARVPIVAGEQKRVQKLEDIAAGPQWVGRRTEAQSTLNAWEASLYRGSSMAAIKADMMDHYTELLQTARVTGYNVNLADKPFAAPITDQKESGQQVRFSNDFTVMTITFSGNFNAESMPQFMQQLYAEGHILRLESVNISPSKFEVIVKTIVATNPKAEVGR